MSDVTAARVALEATVAALREAEGHARVAALASDCTGLVGDVEDLERRIAGTASHAVLLRARIEDLA